MEILLHMQLKSAIVELVVYETIPNAINEVPHEDDLPLGFGG
jgi:hypothetical protein